MRPVLVLLCMCALAPASGCLGAWGARDAACEWLDMSVRPAGLSVDIEVRATNCEGGPRPIDGEGCHPLLDIFPTTRIGDETYVIGFFVPQPRARIACDPDAHGWREIPGGEGRDVLVTWDGTFMNDTGARVQAPAGEYLVEARFAGRLDVVPVQLDESGVFTGGRE